MKILIAEDEPVIAQRIERLAREILGERITTIKNFSTIKECKSYLDIHQIDLLFLDLNLKGQDGFDILNNEQASSFYTVIISAYSKRAIEAFNYDVIDFIEKPFNKERLQRTFEKLSDLEAKHNFTSKFLSIKRSGEIKLIEISTIIYIRGAGVYSELFIENDIKELHHQNLEKIDILLPTNFVRIHKSYIANMFFAEKFVSHGGSKYSLQLKNGNFLPVSRNRYKELKEMFTLR